MKWLRHFAGACLLAAFAAPAHSVVVSYNESVDCDLSSLPLTTFTFDLGINTIAGRFAVFEGPDGGPLFDFDVFAFTVPLGAEALGQVELTDVTGNVAFSRWAFRTGLVLLAGTEVDLLSADSPGIGVLSAPIGAGDYNVFHEALAVFPVFAEGDYTFTFTLRPVSVPEPATLALLGIGLAGLGFSRRKPFVS